MKQKTLKFELIFIFIALLTAAVLIITVFMYKKMMRNTISNIEDISHNNFLQIEKAVVKFKNSHENLLYQLFINKEIQEFIASDNNVNLEEIELRRNIGKLLDQTLYYENAINSVIITTEKGNAIGTFNHRKYNYNVGFNESDRMQAADYVETKYPIWGIRQNKTYLADEFNIYTSKVFSGDTKVEIYIDFTQEGIRTLYSDNMLFPNSSLFICSEDGIILSHQDSRLVGTRTELLGPGEHFDQYSSFQRVTSDKITKQIVSSKLQGFDWVVVEEIPISDYTKGITQIRQSIIIILLITIVFAILSVVLFIRKITVPLEKLKKGLELTKEGVFGHTIEISEDNEFKIIIERFNSMSGSIENLVLENAEKERQKADFAFHALMAQINPHFIFNTLNMIKWMSIAQNTDNITQSLGLLMGILKPIFKDTEEIWSLQEEIDYLEKYLALTNLRFGGNVRLTVELSDTMKQQEILRYILQPIIENSIEHGFVDDYSSCNITINATRPDDLCILVMDNGKGIPAKRAAELNELLQLRSLAFQGDNIGLQNVNSRIRLKYGDTYGVSIDTKTKETENKGTTILLKLP